MTGGTARSPGTGTRAFALALVFCAFAVGPGCNRETFDLLDVAGTAGVAGVAGVAGSVQAGAGAAPDTFGGGGNGNELAGGAGRVNLSHGGGAGAVAGGGAGGWQGGFGGYGCAPGQPCMTGGQFCPPTLSSCVRCNSTSDCSGTDSPLCFTAVGHCVQCRPTESDCDVGQVCYSSTYRCGPRCQTSAECVNDHEHPVCDSQSRECVECYKDPDCRSPRPPYCEFDRGVECKDSNDQVAAGAAQCPVDKPYCVAFRCQSRR